MSETVQAQLDRVFAELLQVSNAAQKLIQAMDRQHGDSPFSLSVTEARDDLRGLLVPPKDDRDFAKRKQAA